MSEKQKPYRLKVVREYTDSNGEVKEKWDEVGIAWPMNNKGFRLDIPLLGKDILMFPPKDNGDAEKQKI